jgi:hypothetical protein
MRKSPGSCIEGSLTLTWCSAVRSGLKALKIGASRRARQVAPWNETSIPVAPGTKCTRKWTGTVPVLIAKRLGPGVRAAILRRNWRMKG